MSLNLTPETLKLLDDKQAIEERVDLIQDYEMEFGHLQESGILAQEKKADKTTLVVQKVTKFEGILIEKVFFSNKNIYGNLMLSTCRQADKSTPPCLSPIISGDAVHEEVPNNQTLQENLMIHRLKDLFSVQNDGRMVNCPKLGVYIPKDFVQSRRFPVQLGYTAQEGALQMPQSIRNVELFSEMFMATFEDNV